MPRDRPHPTRRRLLRGIATAAAGTTLLAGCASREETPAPPDSSITSPPAAAESPTGATDDPTPTPSGPREVQFPSTADTTVTGTLYGSGEVGVVLVPQINLDRESWAPQATALAERGATALAIDEDPDDRAASALGAGRYLRETVGVSRLVLVGASSGGEAVVRASARATASRRSLRTS